MYIYIYVHTYVYNCIHIPSYPLHTFLDLEISKVLKLMQQLHVPLTAAHQHRSMRRPDAPWLHPGLSEDGPRCKSKAEVKHPLETNWLVVDLPL